MNIVTYTLMVDIITKIYVCLHLLEGQVKAEVLLGVPGHCQCSQVPAIATDNILIKIATKLSQEQKYVQLQLLYFCSTRLQ